MGSESMTQAELDAFIREHAAQLSTCVLCNGATEHFVHFLPSPRYIQELGIAPGSSVLYGLCESCRLKWNPETVEAAILRKHWREARRN
jgi:hypothetical protein